MRLYTNNVTLNVFLYNVIISFYRTRQIDLYQVCKTFYQTVKESVNLYVDGMLCY